MQQCPGNNCPPTCGPRFVTVQQPSRLVTQKQVIMRNRCVIQKHVVPCTRTVVEPKLVYYNRTICEPKVTYHKYVVHDPKIVYCTRNEPAPKLVCKRRTVNEPHEICQTIMCQPKPQVVPVPPAFEFCCYKTAPPADVNGTPSTPWCC